MEGLELACAWCPGLQGGLFSDTFHTTDSWCGICFSLEQPLLRPRRIVPFPCAWGRGAQPGCQHVPPMEETRAGWTLRVSAESASPRESRCAGGTAASHHGR